MENVNHITIFGLHLTINKVAFKLPIFGGWEIRWYGIIIAIGFLLALLYAYKYAKRFNIDINRAIDVVIVTVPVAIICARMYYLIFDSSEPFRFSNLLPTDRGFSGLAIYGGVIGAFACGALMCYLRKVNILDMFDLAAMGFLIGQGVGRWGNFTNQEAFGAPTGSKFFGMTSESVVSDFIRQGYDSNALAHPCFLYESMWCIAGFFIIHKLSGKRRFSGETFLMYGTWYGFGRAIIEGFRTDSLMLGNLRVSQLLSVLLCLTCAALLVILRKKFALSINDSSYVPMITADDETDGEEAEEETTDIETREEITEAENEQDN